jgi:type IV pilus assembly protein PilE
MKRQSGFTLIELMITVAVIAVLSAIALPSYQQYAIRARLTDAFSALSSAQASAEQFWSSNRTYVGFQNANGFPVNSANFTYTMPVAATSSTYAIAATGAGPVLGFAFTIDQNGNKATTAVPAGWTASATCWINKKGGACVQ